jgi:hypothetical protein
VREFRSPCSYVKERWYTGRPLSRSLSIITAAGLKMHAEL